MAAQLGVVTGLTTDFDDGGSIGEGFDELLSGQLSTEDVVAGGGKVAVLLIVADEFRREHPDDQASFLGLFEGGDNGADIVRVEENGLELLGDRVGHNLRFSLGIALGIKGGHFEAIIGSVLQELLGRESLGFVGLIGHNKCNLDCFRLGGLTPSQNEQHRESCGQRIGKSSHHVPPSKILRRTQKGPRLSQSSAQKTHMSTTIFHMNKK